MKLSVKACSLTPEQPDEGVGRLLWDPDCPSAPGAACRWTWLSLCISGWGRLSRCRQGRVQGAGPRQAGLFSSAHHLTTTVKKVFLFTLTANEQWVRKQTLFETLSGVPPQLEVRGQTGVMLNELQCPSTWFLHSRDSEWGQLSHMSSSFRTALSSSLQNPCYGSGSSVWHGTTYLQVWAEIIRQVPQLHLTHMRPITRPGKDKTLTSRALLSVPC